MKKVAVIGAVHDRTKYANKAVRAFLKSHHIVYPVHPAQTEAEGLTCYKSISEVPEKPDIVSVYVGPGRLLGILPEIARKGCGELWLNPGTESAEVLETARELGVKTVQTCSILAVGFSPAEL